jgi:hypothetical protein
VWAVEGLGHYYADTFYERNEVPRNLLTDPKLADLPLKSMTMLHAGIGLSFAQQNLLTLTPNSSPSDVRKVAENIVALCKNSSRPGYAGCAIESLGLVARNFHGLARMRSVHEALSAFAPELVPYLWRGAGRAVYFSVPNFIPGWDTPWRAVEMCYSEPADELGRRSMVSGFAWAATVVNMRNPVVVETMLKYHGDRFAENDAFANGVMCSMIMRYDTSPDDPYIEKYLAYQPDSPDAKVKKLWDRLIKEPCQLALREYYPVIKKKNRVEDVFRYQDLAVLAKS